MHFTLQIFLLTVVAISSAIATIDLCNLPSENDIDSYDCQETEYNAYWKCIESQKESRRIKRQTITACKENKEQFVSVDMAENISDNCNRINLECRNNCADNITCVDECPVCPIFIHTEIDPNKNTESISKPIVDDYRTIIVEGTNGTNQKFDYKIEAGRNVTTVIKLSNLINNTNTIHMPTNVSTSNVNHIHIHRKNGTTNGKNESDNSTGGAFGLGSNARGSCCLVSRPKNCVQTPNGQRCHYQKQKTCGPQCTAKIIHARSKKICHPAAHKGCARYAGAGGFVSQPQPQKCVYIDAWPFVSCGGSYASNPSCDGCYDLYENADDTNLSKEDRTDCQGCYDDGFEYGPLYRRGPVLQPFYYPTVPCYIIGTCYPVPVVPDWNLYQQSDVHRSELDENDFLNEFEIEIDTPKPDNSSSTNDTENWSPDVVYKCKVVSDDGSIEIRNCSSSSLDDNPYATYPVDEPEGSPNHYVRPSRHVPPHTRISRRHLNKAIVEDENLSTYDENDSEENDVASRRHRSINHRSRQHYERNRRPNYYYENENEDDDEY